MVTGSISFTTEISQLINNCIFHNGINTLHNLLY